MIGFDPETLEREQHLRAGQPEVYAEGITELEDVILEYREKRARDNFIMQALATALDERGLHSQQIVESASREWEARKSSQE